MKFGGAAVTTPTRIGGELYSRRQIKKLQIINVSNLKLKWMNHFQVLHKYKCHAIVKFSTSIKNWWEKFVGTENIAPESFVNENYSSQKADLCFSWKGKSFGKSWKIKNDSHLPRKSKISHSDWIRRSLPSVISVFSRGKIEIIIFGTLS